MNKYLIGINVFNEGPKIKRVLEKFIRFDLYDILILDDGSTDGALDNVPLSQSLILIRNAAKMGAGYTTRQIIHFAQEKGYDAIIFVSGNDKDDPGDVAKLISAIEGGYDFVQGSRFLPAGAYGNMPLYRVISTKFIHPLLFSFFTGRHITDSTNGFRAIRMSFFKDERMDINQSWLDQYELEPYLFFYALKLGYKVMEVPVRKIYPPRHEGYTKIKPFSGWWSLLRPVLYLGLRIHQ